jgi:hypothetical protein
VRFVAAGGVGLLAVDHFLQDQVAARVLVEGRGLVYRLEIADVAVRTSSASWS